MTKEQAVEVKKDVKDLLNQILIKLESLNPAEVEYESDDDYDNNFETKPGFEDLGYLAAVKAYVGRVIRDDSSASYNEQQYHNSNCY